MEVITPRDYPRIKTLQVTDITEEGATLNSRIVLAGNQEILEYGFVWNKRGFYVQYATLPHNKVVLKGSPGTETFSARVTSTLEKATTYYVRSFVRTADYVVYGDQTSFLSLGSSGPVVTQILPGYGTVGDTVAIHGNGFSFIIADNSVTIGSISSQIVAASDSVIKVIIPVGLNRGESNVSVSTSGLQAKGGLSFKLSRPIIAKLTPSVGTDFTEIEIEGDGFSYHNQSNRVVIGTKVATVLSVSKKLLKVAVPAGLMQRMNDVVVNVAAQSATLAAGFTMLPPNIGDFQPQQASPGTQIVITGDNFSTVASANIVHFGDVPATVVSASKTTITVVVPSGVPTDSYITVVTAEQTSQSTVLFRSI